MKKWFEKILLATFIILIVSCAATIRDISEVSYIKEGFNTTSLQVGGLALLPVHAGAGQEGYRRPLADAIDKMVITLNPNLKFSKWQETAQVLSEHELVKTYQDVILTYRETAILNEDFLHKLGSALGKRYLMFVSLERFHKASKTTYSMWSGWETTETAEVNAFAQIWDCSTGDVVWEGFGAAKSVGTELMYTKGYGEHAQLAAEGLIRKLFNLPSAQPKY
ncbi:MAG: hypothetical protein KAW56_13750 [Candidatus Marinimicrobia bacterium]|nr:hypothetical protein [Candidatus Neomarinimicrobiota bacterium]